MKTGIKIQKIRQEKGLSVEQLSGLTGINASVIHEYELCTRAVQRGHLNLLSKALQYPVRYLENPHVIILDKPDRPNAAALKLLNRIKRSSATLRLLMAIEHSSEKEIKRWARAIEAWKSDSENKK